jgi:transposase
MHSKSPIRRNHSPEFKASVLAACRKPGVSIAGVALAHGVNANVVHKWLAGIGMKRCAANLPVAAPSPMSPMQFLPVDVSASHLDAHKVSARSQDIRLDLDLGAMQIKLHCPRGSAQSAAALLRSLAEMVGRA